MSFGERLRERREQLNMSRRELAEALGVSVSAIGNYETGISAPKEEVLLHLFDSLQVDPNTLYRDHFQGGKSVLNHDERELLDRYRSLSAVGRDTVRSVMNALCAYRDELEQARPAAEERRIPSTVTPPPQDSPRRYLGRTLTIFRWAGTFRRRQSSPYAFRATPWPHGSPMVRWSM